MTNGSCAQQRNEGRSESCSTDEGSMRGAGLKVMRTEVSVLMLRERQCQVLKGADSSCHYHSASELSQLKGLLCHFGPYPLAAIRKT